MLWQEHLAEKSVAARINSKNTTESMVLWQEHLGKMASKDRTEGTMLRQEHLAGKWVATRYFEASHRMELIGRMEWKDDCVFVFQLTTLFLQPVRFVLRRTNSISFCFCFYI